MNRISLCGVHYSGKTTLAKYAAKKLNIPYYMADLAVPLVNKYGLNSLNELDTLSIEDKWQFQMDMFKCLSMPPGECIADGSPLSCIPYGTLLLKDEINNKNGQQLIIDSRENKNKYTHLFYLPPEIDFTSDNFRINGINERINIDNQLTKELENYPYITLTGSVEDRANIIGNTLGANKCSRSNHIVFEGLCNSGKSTTLKVITNLLNQKGIEFYQTQRLRVNKESEGALITWYGNLEKYKHELLQSYLNLFTQIEAEQHIDDKVYNGDIVFGDRHKFSIIALGIGLGFPIGYLYKLTSHLKTPGTVILFDLDPQEAVRRSSLNNKPMPSVRGNLNLQTLMSIGYRQLAKHHREIILIDANVKPQELFKAIENVVLKVI